MFHSHAKIRIRLLMAVFAIPFSLFYSAPSIAQNLVTQNLVNQNFAVKKEISASDPLARLMLFRLDVKNYSLMLPLDQYKISFWNLKGSSADLFSILDEAVKSGAAAKSC